ncbi:hypothetical protein [Francisella sp. SYW-9]|uniref:hypothetical protein n=1 Tax=Francisella sp. SYW-9 TaxID=2610888 RepID=UPI00123E0E92|nr:hypothetical protein [Francisella sp. SYW-9]
MKKTNKQINNLLRDPKIVMDPKRLGAMHQSRLSFARRLIRRFFNNEWEISIEKWDLSPEGYGCAIYRLNTKNGFYNLVLFSNKIKDNERDDRVIAEKWDVTFALVKGKISTQLFQDLYNNVPKQEYGRNSNKILVLARANKSVRVFDHILKSLKEGKQPNLKTLAEVGYILRTTAVYGNGKFGICDFNLLENNSDFNLAFEAQMCAVYILRQFSIDWIHFIAKQQAESTATVLDKKIQRYIGIGNATGLGMAPFLINHPCVIDQWISEREKVLSLIFDLDISYNKRNKVLSFVKRAQQYLKEIVTIDEQQNLLNIQAVKDINIIIISLENISINNTKWDKIIKNNETLSFEAQEIFISCLLEAYPEYTDPHSLNMTLVSEDLALSPCMTIKEMKELLQNKYDWAISINFSKPENNYWFWYSSENKEEPRLGIRGSELGDDKELPLDIARQVSDFYKIIITQASENKLLQFIIDNPQYGPITRRICTMDSKLMGDIQINILAKDMLPIDLLRCKLSFLGATKFDPRSDRWVRVTFFQGAPLLSEANNDDWLFPLCPTINS